jgi:hypothetical protein
MKLLLFRVHQGDKLDGAIEDVTRTAYVHAAILKSETTNTISEAFFPHVRERILNNSELHGIDVFDISTTWPNFTPMTASQVAAALAHCAKCEAEKESYAIQNLFAFLPGINELIKGVQDDGTTSPVICSQYAFDVISASGIKMLNAVSNDLAPGYLSWSPILFSAPQLKMLPSQPQPASRPSFAQEVVRAAQSVASAVKEAEAVILPATKADAAPDPVNSGVTVTKTETVNVQS